ncbi:MAG: YiaA/YiaB family inner membrane protein [Archangium sp.]|nr:YiaA/YiaB family inner membrane protein [Archangium sp.]MDP3153827.1 YiaA/YiaB family inner membrane protein [Archangium sp.]MDP3569940.1 YiaA/YiaB family inner membrane protein [Archangium sp.]
MSKIEASQTHSSAWIAQVWISFAAAVGVTSMGIWFLPVDPWVKAFMGMGLLFSVGSTFSLAKTVRDQHESDSLRKRIDEARVNRIIAEHDPLKPAL